MTTPNCEKCNRPTLPYGQVWHCPTCGYESKREMPASGPPLLRASEADRPASGKLGGAAMGYYTCRQCSLSFLLWHETLTDSVYCPFCGRSNDQLQCLFKRGSFQAWLQSI